jgi:hypothetical protein
VNPWTALGALVYTGENLSDDTLDHFVWAGGRWITPVIFNDDTAGPGNLALLPHWQERGDIMVGGWFNGVGGDPVVDAQSIGTLVNTHRLPLAVLDLEAAYQYPRGDANLMPVLVYELRKRQPGLLIGVSTNGLNGSMIWNGRTLPAPNGRKTMYDLGVRLLPQWCYGPAYTGCWVDPVCNMTWLKEKGPTDGNMARKGVPSRAVPLSYVHPTVEGTGIEGADLAAGLEKLKAARKYGLTLGLSYYTLERAPASDLELLASVRGTLYV